MNNESFLLITVLILFIYLIIGLYPSKKEGFESFLISNRSLDGASNGFSIAASKIGGGLFITYSALFFTFGYAALFYFVGIIIGYFFFYLFAVKLLKLSKDEGFYTVADYFEHKYNKRVAILIGAITTLSVFGWVITNLVAGSALLSELTLISPIFIAIVLSLIIGAYLYTGGFNSVVRTDIIQYLALIIILVILILSLSNSNVIDYNISNLSFESIPIGQVIGFIVLGILFPMGSAELWQRVYASKNKTSLISSISIASITYIILGLLLSIICTLVLKSNLNIDELPSELQLAIGIKNITLSISPILSTVWLIAFISVIMSSADTFVFTTASSFVQDILEKYEIIKHNEVIRYIRFSIISILIISIVITILFRDVVSITFFFVGITLVLSSLAYFSFSKKYRLNTRWVVLSGIIGVISVISHFYISGLTGNPITALIGFVTSSIFQLTGLAFLRIKKQNN